MIVSSKHFDATLVRKTWTSPDFRNIWLENTLTMSSAEISIELLSSKPFDKIISVSVGSLLVARGSFDQKCFWNNYGTDCSSVFLMPCMIKNFYFLKWKFR